MTEQVDVFGALDEAADYLESGAPVLAEEVRDSVEAIHGLIKAAAEMNRLAKGPVEGVSQSDKIAIIARMDAAIARIQGGEA